MSLGRLCSKLTFLIGGCSLEYQAGIARLLASGSWTISDGWHGRDSSSVALALAKARREKQQANHMFKVPTKTPYSLAKSVG